MSNENARWEIQSSSRKINFSVAFLMGGVGLFFLITAHERTSAFVGGLFLVVYGAFIIFMQSESRLIVDPEHRTIRVERQNRMGTNSRLVPFSSVDHVRLIQNGVWGENYYGLYIALMMKDGSKIGAGRRYLNREEAEGVALKLSDEIGCGLEPPRNLFLSKNVAFALGGAVLTYVIFYRFEFGQICAAMWFGTAPIIIIGASFWMLLEFMRNLLD